VLLLSGCLLNVSQSLKPKIFLAQCDLSLSGEFL
jgi:hypothetical protein